MKNLSYITISVILLASYACTKPIEACFTHSPEVITTSTDAVFDASCSQNASYFTWNFGDSFADTTTTSSIITHQYTASGSYTVTLGAQRKDGKTAGKDKLVFQKVITVQ